MVEGISFGRSIPYTALLGAEKGDIAPENTYFGDVNIE